MGQTINALLSLSSGVIPRLTRFSISYNPWQCKCLNDLLQWAQRNDIVYSSVTFNGERPVCIGIRNSTCVRDMDWVNQNNIVQLYDEAITQYNSKISKATTEPSSFNRLALGQQL